MSIRPYDAFCDEASRLLAALKQGAVREGFPVSAAPGSSSGHAEIFWTDGISLFWGFVATPSLCPRTEWAQRRQRSQEALSRLTSNGQVRSVFLMVATNSLEMALTWAGYLGTVADLPGAQDEDSGTYWIDVIGRRTFLVRSIARSLDEASAL